MAMPDGIAPLLISFDAYPPAGGIDVVKPQANVHLIGRAA
jgi:hypothetical protein